MPNYYLPARRVRRPTSRPTRLLVALAFPVALLPALPARAQAPSWQLALAPTQLAGGTSQTQATATDAAGNVYLTGQYTKQVQFGSTVLTSAGGTDVFVACYRPASGTWAWATSGGGTGDDSGRSITTDGTRVYVTGDFLSNTNARFAGQALAGAGSRDVFVAAYAAGTGAGTWATSGGGTDDDIGSGLATDGTRVYATGYFTSNTNAGFAGQALAGAGKIDAFVVAYAAGTGAGAWVTSGGGTGFDVGNGIATDGTRVYVTGSFGSSNANFAGQALAGVGSDDAFVAAYAAGTGAGTWATSGGGTYVDYGNGIATDGTRVYVTGGFSSNTNARIAGQALAGAGDSDAFVAAYAAGTGAAAWATSGGGTGFDVGNGLATDGTRVYVAGSFPRNTNASFAGQALAGTGFNNAFVAAYAAGTGAGTWATSGTNVDSGNGIAAGSAGVYTGVATGSDQATFGGFGPLPANAAGLVITDKSTGAGLGAISSLTGGYSQTRATATDAAGNVYLTGNYSGQLQFGSTVLTSAGGLDVFVACYRPASGTWAWATSGGGSGNDEGLGIATDGTRVYVTGSFVSNARFAGQALAGVGSSDAFVAAYAAGTGAGAWVTSGGGTNVDSGNGIATDGTRVYVTGSFASNTNANFAGQALAGVGSTDAFVAAYAAGTGAGAWATSGGGTGNDFGNGLATDGTRVYVTGGFASNTNARIAGQALAGTGKIDAFVAAYAAGTGAGGGAVSGGGTDLDLGYGIAVGSAGSVWVGGFVAPSATFGATTLAGINSQLAFLGQVYAPIALATVAGGAAGGLVLYPNPAAATQALTLELPAALSRYAATAVLSDALGRVARTQQLPASSGAVRTLAVAGLAPGFYVLRLHTPAGELSSKLTIE